MLPNARTTSRSTDALFLSDPVLTNPKAVELWLLGYTHDECVRELTKPKQAASQGQPQKTVPAQKPIWFAHESRLMEAEIRETLHFLDYVREYLEQPQSMKCLRFAIPRSEVDRIIYKFYEFDSVFIRHAVGKKLSRKDRTKLINTPPIKTRQQNAARQFDNLRRVCQLCSRVIFPQPPSVAIAQEFCVPPKLAQAYACCSFLCFHRFHLDRRQLNWLSLDDLLRLARVILISWCVCAKTRDPLCRHTVDDHADTIRRTQTEYQIHASDDHHEVPKHPVKKFHARSVPQQTDEADNLPLLNNDNTLLDDGEDSWGSTLAPPSTSTHEVENHAPNPAIPRSKSEGMLSQLVHAEAAAAHAVDRSDDEHHDRIVPQSTVQSTNLANHPDHIDDSSNNLTGGLGDDIPLPAKARSLGRASKSRSGVFSRIFLRATGRDTEKRSGALTPSLSGIAEADKPHPFDFNLDFLEDLRFVCELLGMKDTLDRYQHAVVELYAARQDPNKRKKGGVNKKLVVHVIQASINLASRLQNTATRKSFFLDLVLGVGDILKRHSASDHDMQALFAGMVTALEDVVKLEDTIRKNRVMKNWYNYAHALNVMCRHIVPRLPINTLSLRPHLSRQKDHPTTNSSSPPSAPSTPVPPTLSHNPNHARSQVSPGAL